MRLFHGLLVIGVLAGCEDTGSLGDCTPQPTVDHTYTETVSTASAPLQLKVESCRLDIDACPSLCAMELRLKQVQAVAQSCVVSFSGDSVAMRVTYNTLPTDGSCGFGGIANGGTP